ncbi:MAG: hypothetical protein DRJ65_00150 [Acidobacteria bacterium]|nr:MAG: hypothetical protein DRJ65_00150 [Acidobacteriota bacterium]
MTDRQELKDILRELLGELGVIQNEDPGPPPPTADAPWTDVLDQVDWLEFVRGIQTGDLAFWPDFCSAMSGALQRLDLSASLSLTTTVKGLAMWFWECAMNDDLHKEVRWSVWLEAIEAYLVKEDSEPGEYQGTTFAEFCEALAATMGNVPGLHTWQSEHFSGIRQPPTMHKVFWFISMVLWRIPEWQGEGLRAGEMTPKEYGPPTTGDTPWSQPGQ